MAKALFGYAPVADNRSLALAAEVRSLRLRVTELEQQLEQACQANEELHRAMSAMSPRLADDLHADLDVALLSLDEPAYS